ncbi:hypothetical protein RRG08_047408 [Elysia crispata]|uniref:Uncharacterized protein n=1 Tax=Elysia crispata TaxID=231223 RepID=A0AAE1D4Q5_9GAST|nr:hypothetical protein RRG08_047408 [Elysia crispata]
MSLSEPPPLSHTPTLTHGYCSSCKNAPQWQPELVPLPYWGLSRYRGRADEQAMATGPNSVMAPWRTNQQLGKLGAGPLRIGYGGVKRSGR